MNVPRFIRRLFRAPFDGLNHFGVVTEGKLYRCGQPRPEQLAELIKKHQLKTVISFRGARDDEDPDRWEADERAVCDAAGVAFVTLPCNHRNPPTRDQVARFLELVRDPQHHAVLMHCRLGQQRTLLYYALYRVHVDGVAPDAAEQDMDQLGFGAHVRRHRELLEAYRRYARDDFSAVAAGS